MQYDCCQRLYSVYNKSTVGGECLPFEIYLFQGGCCHLQFLLIDLVYQKPYFKIRFFLCRYKKVTVMRANLLLQKVKRNAPRFFRSVYDVSLPMHRKVFVALS